MAARRRPNPFPPVPRAELDAFIAIVRKLRRECPWDRKQTHQSLRHSLIEETYEVIEALDTSDLGALKSELGDLLLHVVLQATIAEQAREFTLREVVSTESEKLVRRHPHVFGTVRARSAEEVRTNWENIKLSEGRTSLLEGVPSGMPSLLRAFRVQQRAAKVGFDWEDREQVWEKVREEVEEVRLSLRQPSRKKREEEFGDLLFALVNYARFLAINPELALRRTIDKFTRRFQYIERTLRRQGKDIRRVSLAEMDTLWNQAKTRRLSRSRKTSSLR
jgi:MazG family protein